MKAIEQISRSASDETTRTFWRVFFIQKLKSKKTEVYEHVT